MSTSRRIATQDDELLALKAEFKRSLQKLTVMEQEKKRLIEQVDGLQLEKSQISQMFKSKSEEYEEFQQAVQHQITSLKSDNSHMITQITNKLENKYQLQLLSLKE